RDSWRAGILGNREDVQDEGLPRGGARFLGLPLAEALQGLGPRDEFVAKIEFQLAAEDQLHALVQGEVEKLGQRQLPRRAKFRDFHAIKQQLFHHAYRPSTASRVVETIFNASTISGGCTPSSSRLAFK